MKKTLIAATVLSALATPALAMGPFYVAFDNATKSCKVMTKVPSDTDKFAMMGEYKTEADAKMAMSGMSKCK